MSHAQDAADAKGVEAHSCQELMRADDDVLCKNHGITAGLRAQLQEGREKEAELERCLEVARGLSVDAKARLEGCKTRQASLMESGRHAVQDLRV